jgi:predicted nucleotidyltransferase
MKKPLTAKVVSKVLKKEFPYLRKKYGVEKIALYGSFARGAHTAKSDVDILVQLGRPLGLEYVGLANYLEEILGRKVDLATFDMLRRSLKNPRYRHIAADVQRTLRYV